MKRFGIFALTIGLILVLSFAAFPKAELSAIDMEFAGKPFNPGDSGRVQRILLRDQDVNRDDVILTKLSVENLGTATNTEIAWVKVELDIEGKVVTLAESSGFPISVVLLSLPLDQRTIPDDTSAVLTVYVGVSQQISDGHTIQTQVEIRFSEREEGGQLTVKDSKPEILSITKSFFAESVPVEGGVLNPGDELPAMQLRLRDAPDSNFWGLQVTEVRVTGPPQVQWVFGSDTQKHTIQSGRWVTLEEPVLAALDESEGIVTLWAKVPLDINISTPLIVNPQLDIVLAEGEVQREFSFSDTAEDTIVQGGFEELRVSVGQAGKILQAPQEHLPYSTITLRDQDRNNSYLRVHNLKLRCLGTVCNQLSNIEIEDSQGNFIGYSQSLGQVDLSSPSGGIIQVPDEGMTELLVSLDVGAPVPIGGSLLLSHSFEVQEIVRMGEKTHFSGAQQVVPGQAIFFGRPTFGLSAEQDSVSVTTDGETIKTIVMSLAYGPDPVSIIPEILPGPDMRLIGQEINTEEGLLVLTLEARKPSPGIVASVSFQLAETATSEVELQISLDVNKVVDTAEIELPYAVRPASAVVSLKPPVPPEEAPEVSQEEAPAVTEPETLPTEGPAFVGLTLASSYRQGDLIDISFGMVDENGMSILNASVSISIVKVKDDQTSEVVYVDVIAYNPASEKYDLIYDTSQLSPATYDLYISSSRGPSQKIRIEVKP
jgi:hypothetical protein